MLEPKPDHFESRQRPRRNVMRFVAFSTLGAIIVAWAAIALATAWSLTP